MESPSKKLACLECEKRFANEFKLNEHSRIHTGERPFLCCKCGRSYVRVQHLRRHEAACGDPGPSTLCSTKDPSIVEKKYRCPRCPPENASTFAKKKSVWAHLSVVHGERRHECTQCGKAFVCLSKLEAHASKHHDHFCDKCEFHCREFSELRTHIRRVHPTKHICTDCGREFHQRSALRDHMTSHLPSDQRQQYSCPYPDCGKSYSQRRNLVQHCHRQHEGRQFPCPKEGCTFHLASKQKLELHIRLHESGRPLTHTAPSKKKKPSIKTNVLNKEDNSCVIISSDLESDSSIKCLLRQKATNKACNSVLIDQGRRESIRDTSISEQSDSSIKELLASANIQKIKCEFDIIEDHVPITGNELSCVIDSS